MCRKRLHVSEGWAWCGFCEATPPEEAEHVTSADKKAANILTVSWMRER